MADLTQDSQTAATPVTADQQAQQELINWKYAQLRRMHLYRLPLDSRRSYLYKQYLSIRDQQTFPDKITKRANTFVPYPQANVETVVSRVDDAFFSNDPFFDTRPRGEHSVDASDKLQLVLEYKLKQGKFKQALESFTRTCAIYGTAGLKVDWDWDYDMIVGVDPIFAQVPVTQPGPDGQPQLVPGPDGKPQMQNAIDPNTNQPIVTGQKKVSRPVPRMCPKFIPIDIYDLLIDPDGGCTAHMVERTWGQLQREFQNAEMLKAQDPNRESIYYPEAMEALKNSLAGQEHADEIIIRMGEIWDDATQTCSLITFADDRDVLGYKDLRSSLRSQSITSYKRKMYGGKPIVLWHGPSQFLHKRNPVLYTSYIKLPNEVYGLGIVEATMDMSDSLNTMVNMVTDNWNLGINRRYAYDVNAEIDHEALNQFNTPGGRVAVSGDPNKVIAPLPFMTPTAGDYSIIEMYRNMIELGSGVSDFYARGVGSAGGNRTSTGIAQVIGESNYRFKMFIRNLELDVVQPLLQMCASMIQQFCTDDIEYMITNAAPGVPKWGTVRPEEIMGVFDFDVVAANYATNKVIKQRQMMALAQIIGQSGYLLERPALLELAKCFEVPQAQKFIKTDQQVQQEQQAQYQQQIQLRNDEWRHEIQMLILQAMLNTEMKARVAQSTPQSVGGPGQGVGGGRPRRLMAPEGKVPGAGLSSAIKSFAQSMGAEGLGLEGLGE